MLVRLASMMWRVGKFLRVHVERFVLTFRIYLVHDELKDKQFELEMSWIGSQTEGKAQIVPPGVHAEAEKDAKAAMEEDSDSETEDI